MDLAGIATLLYYVFGVKVGTTTILLNLPLFFVAYIKLGKTFFVRSVIGTLFFSILLNSFESISSNFNVITNDKLLACIYGGLVVGIGSAIIYRNNSSTGGSELLSNIISKMFPQLKVSQIIVIFDILVVSANVIVLRQLEIGLYSAIAIYIIGKVLEIIGEGTNFTKMIFIVSDKYEQIAEEISKSLGRGSTAIFAQGMYMKEEKKVLWCVASKNEIIKIRQIASKIDRQSFMTIFNAREAYGKGFKE